MAKPNAPPMLSFRPLDGQRERIEDYAEREGISRHAAIRVLLDRGLTAPVNTPAQEVGDVL